MSDDKKTTATTNGNGRDMAKTVAANLYKLAEQLGDLRKQGEAQELRLIGLAKVIERQNIPFSEEQAESIAQVIKEAGDNAHAVGSELYDRANKIRKAGQGH